MKKEQLYKKIQKMLECKECQEIPLAKEGLVIRKDDSDYVVKITKKKK